MVNLVPTAIDKLAESTSEMATGVTTNLPIVGNAALCADSLCTTARAGVNLCCSANYVAKIFFATSCLCGAAGATTSGIALASSATGIPVGAWLGSFGARAFNRAGRYTLQMGNVTNGNVTNSSEIAQLMN